MALYCGIDLHSRNSYLAVMDEKRELLRSRRYRNELPRILAALEPYRSELASIAIESTYNWYWLADGLMDAGYDVRLVNTYKAAQFRGLKFADDSHDAEWLALLQVLGILPEGTILSREERAVRDLLRRRAFLVKKRTSLILASRTVYERNTGLRVSADDIQGWTVPIARRQLDNPYAAEELVSMVPVMRALRREIRKIEKLVLANARLWPEFELLRTAPGIGEILALTIMYETSDIDRFPTVGRYASYCRSVPSLHLSDGKKKRDGNRKNGNKYLSWAFSEAAHFAIRFAPGARRYFERKKSQTHEIVAARALANKMARACYHVMKDQVPFDPKRVFV